MAEASGVPLVMIGATGLLIANVTARLTAVIALVAVTVNDVVPAVGGVPDSTPVLASSVAHAGSVPAVTDQVIG